MRVNRILKAVGGAVVCFVVLAASLVGYVVISHRQSIVLPSPMGPYRVGRTEYDWVDSSRLDPLSDAPGVDRELLIWIWYPTSAAQASQLASYLPPTWAAAYQADKGIGAYLERSSSLVRAHSIVDAPISGAEPSYPVLVLQPGMGPAVADYTVFAENLASHGYVVAGINETDTQNLVEFPDGRVARPSTKGTIPDTADPATVEAESNAIGEVWTHDAVFVMNKLAETNADSSSPFFDKLDLAHIGVFGHSFGGATAIAVCQSDARCKAGADLDGTPLSDTLTRQVSQPFLFLSEGYSQPFPQGCESNKNCQPIYTVYQHVANNAYFITINGAKHFNFTDRSYRTLPLTRTLLLRPMGVVGSIDPGRGLEISNAYLVGFFDKYLRNVDSKLLDSKPPLGSSPVYAEVQLDSRGLH